MQKMTLLLDCADYAPQFIAEDKEAVDTDMERPGLIHDVVVQIYWCGVTVAATPAPAIAGLQVQRCTDISLWSGDVKHFHNLLRVS
jgi:hypothetical protein